MSFISSHFFINTDLNYQVKLLHLDVLIDYLAKHICFSAAFALLFLLYSRFLLSSSKREGESA